MGALAPLALTMGDPAGIGAEITIAAWRARDARDGVPSFFTIDDPDRLARMGVPVAEISDPGEAATVFPTALPVLPERLPRPATPGQADPLNAPAVVRSIERAVALAARGMAGAVVTNPINKKVLYDGAGFSDPGHTEFLARLAGVPMTVMMIAGPSLKVVPVTIHEPLSRIPALLTTALIMDTVRITDAALKRDFAIANPRHALTGLNPHAGEQGAMGREEIEVIVPAIEALRAEGIEVTGPHPADTLFHSAARARYDVAVAMYHDQALIPVKALDFDRGVNVTLGLPFIRTSPDHGTAYDIAGTGRADATSLIEALRLAGDLAARHQGRPVTEASGRALSAHDTGR
ncbi:MAG: 4-hydroxythreonine-4-phosphate dehydrogenase PdxA [Pseudomonadota bacterium]